MLRAIHDSIKNEKKCEPSCKTISRLRRIKLNNYRIIDKDSDEKITLYYFITQERYECCGKLHRNKRISLLSIHIQLSVILHSRGGCSTVKKTTYCTNCSVCIAGQNDCIKGAAGCKKCDIATNTIECTGGVQCKQNGAVCTDGGGACSYKG